MRSSLRTKILSTSLTAWLTYARQQHQGSEETAAPNKMLNIIMRKNTTDRPSLSPMSDVLFLGNGSSS